MPQLAPCVIRGQRAPKPRLQRGFLSRLARFATSFPGTVAGAYIWFDQAASASPVVEVKQQDLNKASTTYVKRQNLSMRMCMRRFTRLTNGFSKKVENLACAVSLHYMYYNFARPKNDTRDGCRVANRVWTHRDITALLD